MSDAIWKEVAELKVAVHELQATVNGLNTVIDSRLKRLEAVEAQREGDAEQARRRELAELRAERDAAQQELAARTAAQAEGA